MVSLILEKAVVGRFHGPRWKEYPEVRVYHDVTRVTWLLITPLRPPLLNSFVKAFLKKILFDIYRTSFL